MIIDIINHLGINHNTGIQSLFQFSISHNRPATHKIRISMNTNYGKRINFIDEQESPQLILMINTLFKKYLITLN